MRSLAAGSYTAAEVEARFRNPGRYARRFEVLDADGNLVGPLEGVSAAVVKFDIDQTVKGGLDLEIVPEPEMADRLRSAPFRYRIKAYFSCGPMSDGGMAEFPMGVYVWQQPTRVVRGVQETWTVELGDLTHILDCAGPDPFPNAFRAPVGRLYTDAIRDVYRLAGFDDLSGVAPSGARFTVEHSWTAQVGGDKLVRNVENAHKAALAAAHQARANAALAAGNIREVWLAARALEVLGTVGPVWEWKRLENTTQTWGGVLSILHDAIGYESPHVDLEGVPRARPSRDYSLVDPVFTFDSSHQSITVVPLDTDADTSSIANRVLAIMGEADNPAVAPAVVANLNTFLPDHPLAERQIGFFINALLPSVNAPTVNALAAAAKKELFERLSFYESATLHSLAWPFIEALDPVAIRIDGDPELSATQLFQHRGWSLDLFTGKMSHDVRRFYRTLSAAA